MIKFEVLLYRFRPLNYLPLTFMFCETQFANLINLKAHASLYFVFISKIDLYAKCKGFIYFALNV